MTRSPNGPAHTGYILHECLIALLLFSLVTVNTGKLLLESLRSMSRVSHYLSAARLVADAVAINELLTEELLSAELQNLSLRTGQTLPEGEITTVTQDSGLLIEVTWSEPGTTLRQSYSVFRNAG